MSEDGVNYVQKGLSSGNVLGLLTLAEKGLTFQVRYVTLWVQRGFQDAETGRWGTTIRDFGVLQFSNIVRGKVPLTNSLWEYPPSWTVDDNLNTEWTSRFGALEAQLIYDLGRERNVAGMTWVFGHISGRVDVHYANRNDNRSNWQRAYTLVGNVAEETVVPTTVHFKCRFIRLTLHEPRTREFWHPDNFGDTELWNTLLSLKDFKAYEHTGGGGVLGFQSVDGMEYTTVAYGLRQPAEWILASEEDLATQDIHPGFDFNDVGQIVHIALTKRKVGGSSTTRVMEYSFYRNGLTYGEPYTVTEPINRMNGPGNVRVIMGVRSSAHYPVPATDPGPNDIDPRNNVIHGITHSPFFEGWIYNVTLFKNALTAEEVRGLFEAHAQGGQEVGCHCFDACPTGANRFFPNVQVPCSGQGACLRTSGQAFAWGRCECALCEAEEEDFKTDTDLDSRPDSSVSLEEPFAELRGKVARGFAELHDKMARGDYDEVLSEVNRYKAYLQLVEGKALHARAGTTFGDKKRATLRAAQDAGRESEKLLSMLSPERQEKTVRDMYAEALLLQANTGARLAAGAQLAENDAMFETARCKAEKAIEFLERFASASDLGAAYRVRGAVELCQKKYQEAEGFFKLALQKFEEARQCGVHEKTEWHMWHAVSYWNMYVVKKETGKLQEAVAWLKQAILLHESVQGGDHPYTIQYRDCLVKLQQSINPQNPISHKTKLNLSDNEVETIERALGIDIDAIQDILEVRVNLIVQTSQSMAAVRWMMIVQLESLVTWSPEPVPSEPVPDSWLCNPGYSGSACESHCSDLSVYGCCEVDDDCPVGITCNLVTRACSE
eukprot:symbB.v1.2.001476.t1/scaffold48.1/size388161/9